MKRREHLNGETSYCDAPLGHVSIQTDFTVGKLLLKTLDLLPGNDSLRDGVLSFDESGFCWAGHTDRYTD